MALAGQGGHCVCEAKGRERARERDGFKVGHVCESEKERRSQYGSWELELPTVEWSPTFYG